MEMPRTHESTIHTFTAPSMGIMMHNSGVGFMVNSSQIPGPATESSLGQLIWQKSARIQDFFNGHKFQLLSVLNVTILVYCLDLRLFPFSWSLPLLQDELLTDFRTLYRYWDKIADTKPHLERVTQAKAVRSSHGQRLCT